MSQKKQPAEVRKRVTERFSPAQGQLAFFCAAVKSLNVFNRGHLSGQKTATLTPAARDWQTESPPQGLR